MKINLVYGSSTNAAPSGFTTAMQYAADQFDALITDNVTVSIDIAWDSSGQILGEAGPLNMTGYSYTQAVAALRSHAQSPAAQQAAASMPAADPTGGSGIYLTEAQAEALGLMGHTAQPGGTATFGTGGTVLNFSTTDRAIAGEEDFVGVAEHELAHALCRTGWGDGSAYSLLDLMRFSSAGTIENSATIATASSPPAYFSVDGGVTDLGNFSTYSDYYDWATSVPADSFDAISYPGQANTLSALDETLMAALGFDVACFCPGTRIATPEGEVPVEALAIGDAVLTQNGPARIKWIGRSAYEGRFLGDNPLMLPVVFAPGALGEGVPARPLTVSPGHGLYLAGMLVPAWRLVNGVSVTQPRAAGRVEYLHIELARHALLRSEGAWSESYLNETPRGWFHNAAEYFALYPGEDVPGPACLRRLEEGPALQAVRHALNTRAGLAPEREGQGALHGWVERLEGGLCLGWAQSAETPDVPVTLFFMRGGEILARAVANGYRPDVRAAGWGKGCCGFAVALPAGGGEITVRRAVDGAVLPVIGQMRRAA